MNAKKIASERLKESNSLDKKYIKPKDVHPEHKAFMTKMGSRLLELQEKAGIGTVKLCEQAKISRYTYYLMTRGEVYWNSEKLLKILAVLNIDTKTFFKSL